MTVLRSVDARVVPKKEPLFWQCSQCFLCFFVFVHAKFMVLTVFPNVSWVFCICPRYVHGFDSFLNVSWVFFSFSHDFCDHVLSLFLLSSFAHVSGCSFGFSGLFHTRTHTCTHELATDCFLSCGLSKSVCVNTQKKTWNMPDKDTTSGEILVE